MNGLDVEPRADAREQFLFGCQVFMTSSGLRGSWVDESGDSQRTIYQVFTIRDERIVDWQDCRTQRAAKRFATRR